MPTTQLRDLRQEHVRVGRSPVPVSFVRSPRALCVCSSPFLCLIADISCRTCPLAFCEDCLPPGDLESVGDVLPEFLVLGYGRQSTAHFIKCSDCIEHYSANPTEAEQWRKEQDKIEARAREEGYDF